ncbi:hypothetical protein TURU_014230 [Turdus rufiventris]|nr:hypothetical protein TURU_014230 [Turdus rufiventris]
MATVPLGPRVLPSILDVMIFQKWSTEWTVITVDLSNTPLDLTLLHLELRCEYFGFGDTAHTPLEIELLPMSLKGSISCLILLACCSQPPFYLVKGQILTQAIPVPKEIKADGKSPEVYWAEVASELEEHDCKNSDFPFADTEIVRNQLHQMYDHKYMGPDWINPKAVRLWEVPLDRKLASVIPIYKKGMRTTPETTDLLD